MDPDVDVPLPDRSVLIMLTTSDSDVGVEAPQSLTWPLPERARKLAEGELPAPSWRSAADEWARHADSRYFASVELRPTRPDSSPVRIGVKDTLDVAGFATRLGLRHYRHHPTRTSAVLGRLHLPSVNAKLVTTEINIGRGHGCVNPCFPHLDPAGSSTGCAVAVAGNICDVGVGTDSVGSIRLPAAACGVVGLRLTHDTGHFAGHFRSSLLLDAPGLVTRTAEDLAYVWAQGWFGPPHPGTDPGQRRFRIGVVREVLENPISEEVARAQATVISTLRTAGHTVQDVTLDDIWAWRASTFELCARDAWDLCRNWPQRITEAFGEPTKLALRSGAAVTDSRRAVIVEVLHRIRASVATRFTRQNVDLWLMPAGPRLPRDVNAPNTPVSTIPQPGDNSDTRYVGYASVASLTGLPAITFPVALAESAHAPIEMQAIGPRHSETMLIDFARTVADTAACPVYPLPSRVDLSLVEGLFT
jgi:Asp-tRNA(Asn)/Glu-tRNA(Gln) amidotransferase A subunit family amidase